MALAAWALFWKSAIPSMAAVIATEVRNGRIATLKQPGAGKNRTVDHVDTVVIGAGPNGLVAANVLADHGWKVLVLEAQPVAGGAVRTAELTEPGFHHDVFSAFYPLAAASPVLNALQL